MKATSGGVVVVLAFFLALLSLLALPEPGQPLRAAEDPTGKLTSDNSSLSGTAIAAVIEANGGKPPASGEQLWKTLTKVGKFAQLSIPFSAVRLDSGLGNPRVVIAPVINGLSDSEVTGPNFNGRLFLAANMEKDVNGGDPRVRSVEFISWNTQSRRFDFGVIENMGGESEPELRVVDGGKCFSCHKNRGPILGPSPWSNSAHDAAMRDLLGNRFSLVAAIPPGGRGRREGPRSH